MFFISVVIVPNLLPAMNADVTTDAAKPDPEMINESSVGDMAISTSIRR